MFNSVCSTAKEMSPKRTVDELQKWKDTIGADGGAWRLAIEEEWQQTESKRVALFIKSGKSHQFPRDSTQEHRDKHLGVCTFARGLVFL